MFPQKVDEHGLFIVMVTFTALILGVVGIGIGLFAYWSKKEKAKRARDVNTAINLKR